MNAQARALVRDAVARARLEAQFGYTWFRRIESHARGVAHATSVAARRDEMDVPRDAVRGASVVA